MMEQLFSTTLAISSEITKYSVLTIFLKVKNFSEVRFFLNVIVFLAKVANYIEVTFIKNADIEDRGAQDAGTKITYIGRVFTRDTCSGDAYFSSADAVKYLEMHLQFFWNLKVEGARLDI